MHLTFSWRVCSSCFSSSGTRDSAVVMCSRRTDSLALDSASRCCEARYTHSQSHSSQHITAHHSTAQHSTAHLRFRSAPQCGDGAHAFLNGHRLTVQLQQTRRPVATLYNDEEKNKKKMMGFFVGYFLVFFVCLITIIMRNITP